MYAFLIRLMAICALILATSPALAGHGKLKASIKAPSHCQTTIKNERKILKGKSIKRCGSPVASVPEIDAANAGLALALMGGLVAIRRERRNHTH
jgi:MYXO-CTERM domain-containing protein